MRPTMKGKGFNDVLEIQQNSQQVLTITTTTKFRHASNDCTTTGIGILMPKGT
jgi:hypothetical protein